MIVSPSLTERHQAYWENWDLESYIYHQKIWLEASDVAGAVTPATTGEWTLQPAKTIAEKAYTNETGYEKTSLCSLSQNSLWSLPLLDAPRWWERRPPCSTNSRKLLRHAPFACQVHHTPGHLHSLRAPCGRVGAAAGIVGSAHIKTSP